MADIDLAAAENDLLTIYTREKAIEPLERAEAKFFEGMVDGMPDAELRGNVVEFKIILAKGYGIGTPDDGGDWATTYPHVARKCQITKAQTESGLAITLETRAAGEGSGSFTGSVLAEAVEETLASYMYYKDVLSLGDGSGRLATVAADVIADDTVLMDLPDLCFALRNNQTVEFSDQVVGGTVQDLGGGVFARTILEIDHLAGTVRFDGNVTVTAGWSVYIAGTYGKRKPNGLRSIIDDGRLTSTLFNLSRTDNPEINAVILDGAGGLQDLSEDLLRRGFVQVTNRSRRFPTSLWCNEGIRSEWYLLLSPDRVFTIVGSSPDVPAYTSGMDEDKISFHFRGKRVPFMHDDNLPARELYGCCDEGWRKFTLMPDDWIKEGGQMLHLAPAAGGTTFSNRLIGSFQGNWNVGHKYPNAQVAWTNLRDRHQAGD